MKIIIQLLFLAGLTSGAAQAQVLNLCQPDQDTYREFCARMKHLRATLNVLDQQREMTLANYDYVALMGTSLGSNAGVLSQTAPVELKDHLPAFQSLVAFGSEIQKQAASKDSNVFVLTNQAHAVCLSCHTAGTSRGSSSGWNDVFKMNWTQVSHDCNQPGRNPYLCKSMNGLATSYNHLMTAYLSQIEDYGVTVGVTQEILRILQDLGSKKFFHFTEDFGTATEASAQEIISLARERDQAVFGKAFKLTKSCNQCHSDDRN